MSFSLSWMIFCSSAYGCSHICVSIYEVLFTGLHFITGYKLPPRDRHLSVIDATWIKWDSDGVTTAALGYMGVPNIVISASVSWVILQLPLCSHGHINVCNCAFLSHRASFKLREWLPHRDRHSNAFHIIVHGVHEPQFIWWLMWFRIVCPHEVMASRKHCLLSRGCLYTIILLSIKKFCEAIDTQLNVLSFYPSLDCIVKQTQSSYNSPMCTYRSS